MDSETRNLVIAVVIATILCLMGAFVFDHSQLGHSLEIISLFLSILIVGLAMGNMMNTPSPTPGKK